MAILKVTSLKINKLLSMATNNIYMKFEIEIPKQTQFMLWKPCRLQTDGRTDGQGEFTIPPPSNFVGRGYKYTTNGSSVYLDCFISLPVSRFTSSAHTYMPRLLHSSDCSTVPTFCTGNDLGSWVYFGIYCFFCFLLPTEFSAHLQTT